MLIGVLSDTHGRADRATRAVTALRMLGAEALVHCGDVGTPAVLEALTIRPAWFVWGNTDDPHALSSHAAALGLPLPPAGLLLLPTPGLRIAVCHGHEFSFLQLTRAAAGQNATSAAAAAEDASGQRQLPQIVLHGHTHVAADQTLGTTRFINPGALQRASFHSVALLDSLTGEARWWEIREDSAPAGVPRPLNLRG
ncbi:MAG: metallophosphoesterase family protein [Planctomycetia bacterium]|nr:MAG: metallophosphoesterase family protein [Planctomycetia bacterium]